MSTPSIPSAYYEEAADFVRRKLSGRELPQTALVLGSGLAPLAGELEETLAVPYGDIPHFPAVTNAAHAGVLYAGRLAGEPALCFSGRCHCYEGYSMEEAAFYVGMLARLGVRRLLLTNAAGGIRPGFRPGDLMLIADHIKLGPGSPLTGSAFADMTRAYDSAYRQIALETAGEMGLSLAEGVYIYAPGPQYETPAEIRAFRALGADAVGMSTVPEVIAAAALGIRVLGLSIITNLAAGMTGQPLCDREVLLEGRRAYGQVGAFLKKLLPAIRREEL
ncbi:MAG: purine-nucleoside phosphorylase [Clostridiales bacterium]|nr:purine-nucleoside phosphorylase [Clostridiales bacterium]